MVPPVCMLAQFTANDQGKLSMTGVSFSEFSEAKCWFVAPNTFCARKAVAIVNRIYPVGIYARSAVKKLHVDWDHASASQEKRILTDARGVGANVLKVVDSVENDCDACAAPEKAPHLPGGGTSLASAFNKMV